MRSRKMVLTERIPYSRPDRVAVVPELGQSTFVLVCEGLDGLRFPYPRMREMGGPTEMHAGLARGLDVYGTDAIKTAKSLLDLASCIAAKSGPFARSNKEALRRLCGPLHGGFVASGDRKLLFI